MDPLTALGLASNIVQIISFTAEVLTETHRLVQSPSGSLPSREDLALLAKQQKAACERILSDAATDPNKDPNNVDQNEADLHTLAKSCADEAGKLVDILDSLAVKPRDNGKRRLGSALWCVTKAKWKRSDIEKIQKNLESYQKQLDRTLLRIIRAEESQHAARADVLVRQVKEDILRQVDDSRKELLAAFEKQCSRSDGFLHDLDAKLRQQIDTSGVDDFSNAKGWRPGQGHAVGSIGDGTRVYGNWIGQDVDEARTASLPQASKVEAHRVKREIATTDSILGSLDFPEMSARQIAIPRAHDKTFEWMYEPRSPLEDWLKSSRALFWVNGKAGSGKSTLMRFVTSKPETKGLLQLWAGKESLHIVTMYFWFLGTHLQKSEEGLLRSILYQILSASRDLIPVATPRRWAAVKNALDIWGKEDFKNAAGYDWTADELLDAMERITHCTSLHKFGFFIDGLDEFHADHRRLVKLIEKLALNPDFKFCVSSRPWNVFENAFGSQPDTFVLENLTKQDIRNYVYEELSEHIDGQPEVKTLLDEIAEKAQGVFLWVYLTIKSLLEGLDEGDSIRILRQRVEQLPSDLGDYFDLILSRVHPVYKSMTGTALQLSFHAAQRDLQRPCPSNAHRRSFLNVWLLQNGLEEQNFAFDQQIKEIDAEQCISMVKATRKFISACCKDLLCIPKPPPAREYSDETTYVTQYRVDFLHRTVYEFLCMDEMRQRLKTRALAHVHDPDFDTRMALARLKFVPFESKGRCRFLIEALDDIAVSAPHKQLSADLYAELDKVAARYMKYCTCDKHDSRDVLQMLLDRRLYAFAPLAMTRIPAIARFDMPLPRRPFLQAIMGIGRTGRLFSIDKVDQAALKAYLASGIDMSSRDEVDDFTPWEWFLRDWKKATTSGRMPKHEALDTAQLWTMTKIFIDNGASLGDQIQSLPGTPTAREILLELVPAEHHDELVHLTRLHAPAVQLVQKRAVHHKSLNIQRDRRIQQTFQKTFPGSDRKLPKHPDELDEDEIEAYFRRTGFRP